MSSSKHTLICLICSVQTEWSYWCRDCDKYVQVCTTCLDKHRASKCKDGVETAEDVAEDALSAAMNKLLKSYGVPIPAKTP